MGWSASANRQINKAKCREVIQQAMRRIGRRSHPDKMQVSNVKVLSLSTWLDTAEKDDERGEGGRRREVLKKVGRNGLITGRV